MSVATAASIPWKAGTVNVTYQDTPLKNVLRELFANMGKPVVISELISGNVTGRFNAPNNEFFDGMASVFGLTSYNDGAITYINSASESISAVVALDGITASRFRASLRKMGALDARYTLRVQESEGIAHVAGPPRYVEVVQEIAKMLRPKVLEVAKPTSKPRKRARRSNRSTDKYQPLTAVFRVFPLRYGWAQDTTMAVAGSEIVIPGVASTLRRLVGNYSHGNRPRRGGGVVGAAVASTVSKLRGNRPLKEGSKGAISGPVSNSRESTPRYGAMGMVNVSLPRVEADARTNAVIIHDLPGRMHRYEDLIAQLDKKASLIQIEATIVDVSTDSVEKLGIDFSNGGHTVAFGGGANGRSTAANLTSSIARNFGNPVAGLTTVVGNAGRYFLGQVNLLASEGKAYIHSSPSILTTSNSEAILENTQTFFVRVAGKDDVDLFNVASGTVLRVTPVAIEENGKVQIKMAIRIEDGSITGQVVDNIPVIQRSTVGTQAVINEGQSLLIGGYAYTIDRDIKSKIPLLGDIPGLGALFTFKDSQVRRVERMFMITPRIVAL